MWLRDTHALGCGKDTKNSKGSANDVEQAWFSKGVTASWRAILLATNTRAVAISSKTSILGCKRESRVLLRPSRSRDNVNRSLARSMGDKAMFGQNGYQNIQCHDIDAHYMLNIQIGEHSGSMGRAQTSTSRRSRPGYIQCCLTFCAGTAQHWPALIPLENMMAPVSNTCASNRATQHSILFSKLRLNWPYVNWAYFNPLRAQWASDSVSHTDVGNCQYSFFSKRF